MGEQSTEGWGLVLTGDLPRPRQSAGLPQQTSEVGNNIPVLHAIEEH